MRLRDILDVRANKMYIIILPGKKRSLSGMITEFKSSIPDPQ